MNTIKCPHCQTSFTVNETAYSQLLAQVRGAEFDREIHERLERETLLIKEQAKGDLTSKLADKDLELERLKSQLEQAQEKSALELSSAMSQKDKELSQLQSQLEVLGQQQASELQSALAEKDLELERLKTQLEEFQDKSGLELSSAMSQKEQEILTLKGDLERLASQQALELATTLAEKEKAVASLMAEVERLELSKDKERQEAVAQLEKERDEARSALDLQKKEQALALATSQQAFDLQLKAAQEQVDFYKNFKAQQSTKAIGESLELYAEAEFNKVRALAFPNAYFEKDNAISETGSKGDYIFREMAEQGTELISIMFEMKNEADTTKTKHKNEDFFKELDKDRREKKCEYAVLVSMLEIDNDYYNTGIVDVSHKYPKMYVVRPQFFIQLIGLLRNAALNSLQYKQELALIREQNIDITNFEADLETFKTAFAKNYNSASSNFKKAIDEIDKAIKRMEEVKRFLTTSENQLRLANNKLEDVSVKKLTRKNPTMKAKFEGLKGE